jgi:hypothetical protein
MMECTVMKTLEKTWEAHKDHNLSKEEEEDFNNATQCHLCSKDLCGTAENKTVRDHSHLDGTYRGAAHSVCNTNEGIANKKNYKIPVLFHNLKGYDAHHIIRSIGEHTTNMNWYPVLHRYFALFQI